MATRARTLCKAEKSPLEAELLTDSSDSRGSMRFFLGVRRGMLAALDEPMALSAIQSFDTCG